MKTSKQKMLNESDFEIGTTLTVTQVESFNDIMNTLSNQIQNVREKNYILKKENQKPKILQNLKNYKYYTQNHFQTKLIKYEEYFQSQNKLKQIISTIKQIQQNMKNQKYSQKIQQHKIILDLIEKIKNLMKLLEKCHKNINQTKSLDGFELNSKKKCIQHLDQLNEILKECTKYLVEFEQKLRSSCCSEMEKQQQKIQNKDQKSIKSITIQNQEILRNLLNLMSKQESPKKEYKSTTSSSSKYQIQNLSYYRDLKHYIELMLKQTQKINQSDLNVEQTIKNFVLMLRYVMESLKIIEELFGYKNMCTMSEQQFLSHLDEIKRQIQTVKQNLEKEMTEKMAYEEVSAIVKSTAQVNFYLQKTLKKHQGTQNIQKASIQVPLRDFYNMSEKNSLIEQNILKVLKIIQEKQKQLKKHKKQKLFSLKNQLQSEEQNNKDDTTVVQVLYSEKEMEQKIIQKLTEEKIKIQNLHKTEIENMKNEFETKIKELQDQNLLKNSQITRLTEKVKQSLNMNKKVNKKNQKDDGSWQQMSLNSKSFKDEKNNNFDSMKQLNELNDKIKQLSDKIESLQAQQAELAISIDEKKSQIKKLNQQIQNSHKFISKQNQAKMEQLKNQQIKIIKNHEEQKQNNFQQKQKLAQQLEEQKFTVTELRNTVSLIEQKLLKMNASIKSGELNKLYLEMKKQNYQGIKTQQNIEQTLKQSEYKNLTKNQGSQQNVTEQNYQQEDKQKMNKDQLQTVVNKEIQNRVINMIDEINDFIKQCSQVTINKVQQLENELNEIKNSNKQLQNEQSVKQKGQLQRVNKQLQQMINKNKSQQEELNKKTNQIKILYLQTVQYDLSQKSTQVKDQQISKLQKNLENKEIQLKQIRKQITLLKQSQTCLIKLIEQIDFSTLTSSYKKQNQSQNDNGEITDLLSAMQLFDKQKKSLIDNLLKLQGQQKNNVQSNNSTIQSLSTAFSSALSQLISYISDQLKNIKQILDKKVEQQQKIKHQSNTLQQNLQKLKQSILTQQKKQQQLTTKVTQLNATIQQKSQQITKLNQTQQQLKKSFHQTINTHLQSTVEITQLNNQIQNLQNQLKQKQQKQLSTKKELQNQRQHVQQLQHKKSQNQKTINSLNQDKQTLNKQVSTLKQKISQIKNENEEKIKKLIQESNHLNSSLQLQKGKNQSNLKQIQQLKESLNKLKEQKTTVMMENQRFKSQIRNYSKQQHELKQSARKIKNEAQMMEVDLKEKITNLQKLKEENETQIKTSSEFILQQKHMIQTQGVQIEGLKSQNKLLENHVMTLQKVQSQKIKLDSQVQQLNIKIKELQKKCDDHQRQTTRLNNSSNQSNRSLQAQIKRLKEKQMQLNAYYEQLSYYLTQQYQNQKKQFQKEACKKIDEMTTNFNAVNTKLKSEKKKYQQESLKLSSFLVAIYQAMTKMNEFYQISHNKQYFNVQDHQKILTSVTQRKLLNENQCQQVLLYSVKTINSLEKLIRLYEKNLNDKLDFYENKILQVMNKIDNMSCEKEFKNCLQQFVKSNQNLLKLQKQTDSVDKLDNSFIKFVTKVVQLLQNQKVTSTLALNQFNKEKLAVQQKLRKKIEEYDKNFKTQIEAQIKTKDNQIQNLKQQLQKAKFELQKKQELIKQYLDQINQKQQEIKNIKSQSTKSSIQINKRFKQEKDKLQTTLNQQRQKIEELQLTLQSSNLQISKLQKQLSNSKNSHGNINSGLQKAKQQITQLKGKLQDKQNELNTLKSQLNKKKSQIQQLKQQINKINTQKSSLQNQASQKQVTIFQLREQLEQKKKDINDLTKAYSHLEVDTKKKIESIQKVSTKHQSLISTTQNELNQVKSLINTVADTFSQKVHKKVLPQKLVDEIKSYQPPVGMKLIFSGILHGHDSLRSQVNRQCEEFTKRNIKRTDLLVRYPDLKSMIHQLPKQANDFAFIVLFKTKNGAIFGSFSKGIKKQTFFFSYNPLYTPQYVQQTKVNFYFAKDPSPKIPSVEIFQTKYLQYGSGELRISCIDMSTIAANSDISGGMYYNFDWREIMNEKEENKVSLSEVQLHRVEFEQNS